MTSDPGETRKIIQEAINAMKQGDKANARRLAWHATSLMPESEVPWLLLAAMAEPEDSLKFIKVALEINPNSQVARQAQAWAMTRQPGEEYKPPTGPLRAAVDQTPQPAQTPQPPQQIEEPPPPPEPATPAVSSAAPAADHEIEELRAARKPEKSTGSSAFSTTSIILLAVIAVIVFAMIAGLTFLRPQVDRLLAGIMPTQGCSPTLMVGGQTFAIQTLAPARDGTLKVPAGHSENAYWVADTQTNPVFLFSPTIETLSLATALHGGETAQVTWKDCNSTNYTLGYPAPAVFDQSIHMDQATSQLTLFIPVDENLNGYLVIGELAGETVTSFDTPNPEAPAVEISLLKAVPSGNGNELTVIISVYNYGFKAISLRPEDVSLIPDGGDAQPALSANPPLPAAISPGATVTFTLTFAKTPVNDSTLNVLGVQLLVSQN